MVHTCNPSFLVGWGRRITQTLEAEVAVSWDSTIALQLGQQSEAQKKKKNINQSIKKFKLYKVYSQVTQWN